MSARPAAGGPLTVAGAPTAAERYAELTFDRMPSAVPTGLPLDPPQWVRVPGAIEWIRRLPAPVSDPLVDWSPAPMEDASTEAALTGVSLPGRSEAEVPLDLSALAALLSFGAGVSCAEFGPQSSWRHHRVAPSARCIFPCSVWIIGWGAEGSEPDVCRYHPEHQHLRSQAPFKHRRWTRIHCAVTAAPGVTGTHYGDYAYRLVCQEAGLLTGSLLLAARTLGLRARTVPDHCPYDIDQLLCLDGRRECSLAAVALSGTVTDVVFPAPDVAGPGVRRPCPAFADLGALSSAAHHEFARTRPRLRGPEEGGQEHPAAPTALPCPAPVRLPWQRLRAARDSGDPGFVPAPQPVDADTLERLCGAALTTAFPGVWRGLPALSLLSARRDVPGAECGLFRHDEPAARDDHDEPAARHDQSAARPGSPPPARQLLTADAVTPFLRRCQMVASTNAHQAPATVFIVVDLAAWLRHDAARAYADLHLRTGEAALRLLMAASAEGLAARIHNGFLTGPVREVCGPGRWIAPFAVILSRRRPSARYRFVLEGGL
ncbi:nitroreductase family protein [Streptomyces huasconensis]|uniref:Nitroreductase family protein n=1 Tax=Streptomyces huasconensis TaxID=1854574 RepID=A0ABV3LY13_9ACTN